MDRKTESLGVEVCIYLCVLISLKESPRKLVKNRSVIVVGCANIMAMNTNENSSFFRPIEYPCIVMDESAAGAISVADHTVLLHSTVCTSVWYSATEVNYEYARNNLKSTVYCCLSRIL